MFKHGMRSGICPICGSDEVYSGSDAPMKQGTHDSNAIPVTLWDSAPLDNYVCVKCGYVQSYIQDRALLETIAKKWPRVNAVASDDDDTD